MHSIILTTNQLADLLTKGLSGAKFMYLIHQLGMIDIYSLA